MPTNLNRAENLSEDGGEKTESRENGIISRLSGFWVEAPTGPRFFIRTFLYDN